MWTTDRVLDLIEIYHGAPALWDAKCNEYRDKNKKFDELTRIAEHFDTNVVEVIKKIKSLKTQFRREHKKILKCGGGTGGHSSEKVWFGYKLLKFLITNNESSSVNNTPQAEIDEPYADVYSISSRDDLDIETEVILSENDEQSDPFTSTSFNEPGPSSISPTSHRYKRKRCKDGQVEEAYKLMRSVLENHQRDDFSIYGENVASRMRNATQDSRAIAIAKNKIDKILFSLEMGEFQKVQPQIPLKELGIVIKNDTEPPQSPNVIAYKAESPQSPDSIYSHSESATLSIHNRFQI